MKTCYMVGILHILVMAVQLLLNWKMTFCVFSVILHSLVTNSNDRMPFAEKRSLFVLQKYIPDICQIAFWGQTETDLGNPNCII